MFYQALAPIVRAAKLFKVGELVEPTLNEAALDGGTLESGLGTNCSKKNRFVNNCLQTCFMDKHFGELDFVGGHFIFEYEN
jgi:hypothetical protein